MEQLSLRSADIYKIFKLHKGRMLINGKSYFFKPNESCIELVVERIANRLGINTAHYIAQNVGPLPYYFSADLNDTGDFSTADELGLTGDTLREGFRFFSIRYPELEYYLSTDLVKLYMMDIILMNHDRNSDNWGVLEDDNGARLIILDNDLCFTIPKTVISAKPKIPYYMRKYYDCCVVEDSYDDLAYFFSEYGPGFREMFIRMYELLTPDYVRGIFDSVEKDNGLEIKAKELFLSLYETHYEKLGNVCKNRTFSYR